MTEPLPTERSIQDVLLWMFGRRGVDLAGMGRKPPIAICLASARRDLSAPRLLYGLERLAARPDAPVLVTEGEKAVDAAGLLIPDSICITSQGGSKAPGKSDWTPLRPAGDDLAGQ